MENGELLLITTDYLPDIGGVAWYYGNLVERVNGGKGVNGVRGGRIEVLKLGKWALTWRWPFAAILIIIKSLIIKPERWWVGQVLPIGTVVWLLSFVWRKPYIVSTHGMDVLMPLKSRRKKWLVGKILERAVLITANSEWTKQKVIENYFLHSKLKTQNSKLFVVYPEPKARREVKESEVNDLRLKLEIPASAQVLLTVARLVKRKGIDRVIRALPEVWKQVPEAHYILVGDGVEKGKLLEGVKRLTPVLHDRAIQGYSLGSFIKGRIHFRGAVGDEELAVYYTMADAFILLPREIDGDVEGFGIVYLEADQYGLPIIGCESGGTGEALAKCSRVYKVLNGDDAQKVAHAIVDALNPNAKTQMSNKIPSSNTIKTLTLRF